MKWYHWTLFVIALLLIGVLTAKIGIQNRALIQSTTRLSLYQDSVKVLLNDKGELIHQVTVSETTISGLKNNLDLLEINKRDLKKQVGRWKNLYEVTKGELSSKGTATTIIHLTDTVTDTIYVPSFTFDWNNDYLTLNGAYTDSLRLDYLYLVEFEFIKYQQTRNKTVYDLKFSDPHIAVSNTRTLTITQRKEARWLKWAMLGGGIITGAIISN